MRTQLGEGSTVEQAIENALEKLQVSRDEVKVEILREPSSRRLLRRGTNALVRLTVKEKIEEKNDKIGVASVENGQLRYTEPTTEDGIPARVFFGPDLQVIYDGEMMRGEVTLTKGLEPLEIILPEEREPDLQYGINVNPAKTKAELFWKRIPGAIYRLQDHPPGNQLHLRTRKEEVPSATLTMQHVQELIQIEGLKYGVDLSELNEKIFQAPEGLVTIAQGKEVIPGEPPKITYYYQDDQPIIDTDAVRIDHYEVHGIRGVEEGAILAEKIPGKPGKAGINIYGEPIPVDPIPDVEIQVGPGVKLSEDGLRAIAVTSGLPTLTGGVIQVTDVFELAGNADVSTGNITIDGSIIIKGNVLENVKVESKTGVIVVNGLVSGAILRTGGSITVQRNVVRSQLYAGASTVTQMRLLAMLRKIGKGLEGLIVAYETIATQAHNIPFENLIKHLLELKFYDLPKDIQELDQFVKQLDEKEVSQEIQLLVKSLRNYLVGSGPLRVSNIDLIRQLYTSLRVEESGLAQISASESDIKVGYLQNSQVEASGAVEVTGQGCFYSTILAGTGFKIANGVFRGGEVTINEGDLVANELGGPTGIFTRARLIKDGKITANLVHSNVEVAIGDQSYRFGESASIVKAFLQDGILTIYSGSNKIHG